MAFPESLPHWLNYIESIHPAMIELGLERVQIVRERLDIQFSCSVITVGGTNGKGSTCAFLEAILLRAGYRVACYTSPHLLHFNERARINGESATDEDLCAQFASVETARGTEKLTYFEFTTLAILRLFQHAQPDVIILEVGLGGRLDAVNVIDADCSIVTSVDMDHIAYLGSTRNQIAWEKAHIYRTDKPAICCDPEPAQSLIDYAHSIGASLFLFGRDFNYTATQNQWSYIGLNLSRYSLAYPALRGVNQLLNASGALAALEVLGEKLPVSQQAIRQGLATATLSGRFQVLPGRPTVILDVAHNPHAAAVLAQNLDSMGYYPVTHLVLGMLKDKDILGVIQQLSGCIDHWYLTTIHEERGASAAQLKTILDQVGIKPQQVMPHCPNGRVINCYENIDQAYTAARAQALESDRILVCGSFYTVAGVMALMEK